MFVSPTCQQKANRPALSLPAQAERFVTNNGDQGDQTVSNDDGSRAGRPRQPEATLFDRSILPDPDEGLVRHDAADTSRDAALRVPANTQRAKVLTFLNEHGPSTDPEIADALGLSPNSERPRRVELVSGGYVVDSGLRREHHGSPHIVWAATDAGQAVAGELENAA